MITPPLVLALFFGTIGLGLAMLVAGRWWGAAFPAVFAAVVPLWTQRHELKRVTQAAAQVGKTAAETVAAAATEAAAIANSPHDPDAPPTHSKWRRCTTTITLLALTIACAVTQLMTQQVDGWWLVAACVPLCGMFWYVERQWCHARSTIRLLVAGAAMWSLGLSGNFFASAVTGGMCAQQAQAVLELPLKPITDGMTYLIALTEDTNNRVAAMQQQLDDISRRLATATGGETGSPLPPLSADEITALERIATEGTPLQQAQAIIYLAADKRSAALWAEADTAIARIEADRARGKWKKPADEERYLILKGDRRFYADDPDGAIAPYQAAATAFPNSAVAWNNLGMSRYSARRGDTKALWAAAERAYEAGLRVPSDYPSLVGALHNNLAKIRQDQGDLPGARDSIEQAIAIWSNHLAADHPNLGAAYSNLAAIRQDHGDLPGALASIERAIEIDSKHFASDHPTFAIRYSTLAMIQKDQDDLPGAQASMERAVAIDSKHFAPDHPTFAIRHNDLAMIQKARGDLQAARASMEQAIAIESKHFAPDHPNFAIRYNNLAMILRNLGQLAEALRYMRLSMEIQRKHFAENHHQTGASYSNLALIQQDQCDLSGARASIEQAIAIESKHFAPDHPTFGFSYANLAHICKCDGDRAAACENFKKALGILLKHFDENHPHVKSVRRSMQRAGCTP